MTEQEMIQLVEKIIKGYDISADISGHNSIQEKRLATQIVEAIGDWGMKGDPR